MVQMVTSTVKIKNGDHARMIAPDYILKARDRQKMVYSPPRSCGLSHADCRFGIFRPPDLRNKASETILTSAEVISGSSDQYS